MTLYPSFTPMSEILTTSILLAINLPDSVAAQVAAQDLVRTACAMGGLEESARDAIFTQWEEITHNPEAHSIEFWGKSLALAITATHPRACWN
jgi:hypothetical protein